MIPLLLCAAAVITLWAGGYLFGARRGRAARQALREAAAESARRLAASDAREAIHGETEARAEQIIAELRAVGMQAAEERRGSLRAEIEEMLRPLMAQRGESRRLHGQLEALLEEKLGARDDERIRRVVAEAIRPLEERTGAESLRAAVSEALGPLRAQEQVTARLADLKTGSSRKDLNQVLSAIATQGGFALVTLADERGLLLANSSAGARNAETRAGLSALVLTIADSSAQSGAPQPLSVLLHDTENQTIVNRIFDVDGDRFLLTAVSKGRFVPPNVLDPALEKVETLMVDWTAAQVRPEVSRRAG